MATKGKLKRCQWCGRLGRRGFKEWHGKPECLGVVACHRRSIAMIKAAAERRAKGGG